MTPVRRVVLGIAVLIVAGLLALILRGVIYEIIVLPFALISWQLGIWYRALGQAIWWWLVVIIIFFILMFSLLQYERPRPEPRTKPKPRRGQVEQLSLEMKRAGSGQYFKWLIANRLGKLAYQILLQRESGRTRSVFEPLLGEGWLPSPELRKYLETGLHGSFADYPNSINPFGAPQPTPLDHNVPEVVEFLESQVENGQLPQRRGVSEKTV